MRRARLVEGEQKVAAVRRLQRARGGCRVWRDVQRVMQLPPRVAERAALKKGGRETRKAVRPGRAVACSVGVAALNVLEIFGRRARKRPHTRDAGPRFKASHGHEHFAQTPGEQTHGAPELCEAQHGLLAREPGDGRRDVCSLGRQRTHALDLPAKGPSPVDACGEAVAPPKIADAPQHAPRALSPELGPHARPKALCVCRVASRQELLLRQRGVEPKVGIGRSSPQREHVGDAVDAQPVGVDSDVAGDGCKDVVQERLDCRALQRHVAQQRPARCVIVRVLEDLLRLCFSTRDDVKALRRLCARRHWRVSQTSCVLFRTQGRPGGGSREDTTDEMQRRMHRRNASVSGT
jgi:hypothetical protein